MDQARHEYVKIWVSKTVLGIAAISAVVLRLHVRVNKKKQKIGWDDGFSVLALLFMVADFICNILEMQPHYRGTPPEELTISDINQMSLLSYLTFWWVDGCEVAARFSMIFLYYRLFSIQRWMSWSLKIIGIMSFIWFFVLIFVITFQCTPTAALFDASIHGKCHINNLTGFLISEVINAILDLALVCLPVRSVLQLHLPLREKIGIAAIFAVGGFVVITSMLRIIFGYTPDQGSILGLARLSFWTGVHLAFVVISTCLPMFRSYLPATDGMFHRGAKYFYQSVSRWKLLSGRNSSTKMSDGVASGSDYPTYLTMKDKSKNSGHSVDEIPLTNTSMVSDVERFGRSEYHRMG